MLSWIVVFVLIAILVAILGFGGIYSAVIGIARILSNFFLILFFLVLAFGIHDHSSNVQSED